MKVPSALFRVMFHAPGAASDLVHAKDISTIATLDPADTQLNQLNEDISRYFADAVSHSKVREGES